MIIKGKIIFTIGIIALFALSTLELVYYLVIQDSKDISLDEKQNQNIAPIINGTAEWKSSNGQKYLDIVAKDYYSLGYLEGIELGDKILKLWLATRFTIDNTYRKLSTSYYEAFLTIPHASDYLLEMQGMVAGTLNSTGVPISIHDIFMQNIYIDLSYGHMMVEEFLDIGCTALGYINANGTVTIGQNFDFGTTAKSALAWVRHQVSDRPTVFSLRMGAFLSIPSMSNSYGVKATINIICTNNSITEIAPPSTILSRYGIEYAKSKDELFNLMMMENSSTPHSFSTSFNMILADNESMVAFQHLAGRNIRNRTDTLIVNTNRFASENDDWNNLYFAKDGYSLTRQQHAEALLNQAVEDNQFTNEELINILATKEQLNTGDDSEICRTNDEFSITLAFFTNINFGLGNAYDNPIGKIPIQE